MLSLNIETELNVNLLYRLYRLPRFGKHFQVYSNAVLHSRSFTPELLPFTANASSVELVKLKILRP